MTRHCGLHGLSIIQCLFYEHIISLLNLVIYGNHFEKGKCNVKIFSPIFEFSH
jgi:hypothetical protein